MLRWRDTVISRKHRRTERSERWLGESEQSDKWFPCLIAALVPRSRRVHVETVTAQP